jgi:hypothetical protein
LGFKLRRRYCGRQPLWRTSWAAWLVLATCILASSLAFVDGSVVNVGLSAIGHDLQAGADALQWVVNAYLLPLSALLLLGDAAGYASTQAGAALLPLPLVLAFLLPAMGALAVRIGPRLPLTVGPLVVAVGFAMLTRIDGRAGYWTEVFPALLVIAAGLSGPLHR